MPGPPVSIGCAVVLTPGAAGPSDQGTILSVKQSIVRVGGQPAATVGDECLMVDPVTPKTYTIKIGQGGSTGVRIGGKALVRVGDSITTDGKQLSIVGPPAGVHLNDKN